VQPRYRALIGMVVAEERAEFESGVRLIIASHAFSRTIARGDPVYAAL
jgi:hypothetical protein